MVKQQILEDLKKAVGELGLETVDPVLSISPNPSFGDYSTNIALQLAKQKPQNGKQSSLEIAKKILSNLGDLSYLSKVEIAGPGFINFFVKDEVLANELAEIIAQGANFGKNSLGQNQPAQVEFISANPTGPLTLANGRGGAIGDSIAKVLAWSGYKVDREYYVNDTGNQVRLLGESALAAAGKVPASDNHYKGGYIKDLAQQFAGKLNLEPLELGHFLADYLLEKEIKPSVGRLGISFDEYYSERSLYANSLIEQAVEQLKGLGLTYEKEGALWFKASQFGDDEDRVIVTSLSSRGRQEYTYVMPDIAHHLDVLARGYARRVNVLGADHHSYVKRLNAALQALGLKDKTEVVFMQLVKLSKGGQEVRMSKRAGTYVALDELLEAVGPDAARFFFLLYSPDSHINFDLDLAKERSNKNPVFYVQYAHARMFGILDKGEEDLAGADLSVLGAEAERELVKHLLEFPDLVKEAAVTLGVHRLTGYALKLADKFHRFYEDCPVLAAPSDDLKRARLAVVRSSRIVLQNTLSLLGVSAPDRM